MWSVAKRALALIPTKRGEPRRVATHSPGKWILLKHKEKAPSCRVYKFNTKRLLSQCTTLCKYYQLLNHLLNQLSETVVGVLRVNVLDELGNNFSVSFRLKLVVPIFQKLLNVFVICDDT